MTTLQKIISGFKASFSTSPSTSRGTDETKPTAHEWLDRGIRLYADGDFTDAVKAFVKAAKADPALCAAWVGMGDALYAQKKYVDAMKAYGEAVNLIAAESSRSKMEPFTPYFMTTRIEVAADGDKAEPGNPEYHMAGLGMGKTLSALGKHEEALSAYENAIKYEPASHSARVCHADTLSLLNRH